jgi:hypothetical protein
MCIEPPDYLTCPLTHTPTQVTGGGMTFSVREDGLPRQMRIASVRVPAGIRIRDAEPACSVAGS